MADGTTEGHIIRGRIPEFGESGPMNQLRRPVRGSGADLGPGVSGSDSSWPISARRTCSPRP